MLISTLICRAPTDSGVSSARSVRSASSRGAVLDLRAADHDRELVAAQAGHQAGPLERGAQMAGDGAEHLIAAGMAERIVDLLELVDVDHQQRHLALLRRRRRRAGWPDSRAGYCGWRARSGCRIRPDTGSAPPRACAPRCPATPRHTGSRRRPASRRSRLPAERPRHCVCDPRAPSPCRRAPAGVPAAGRGSRMPERRRRRRFANSRSSGWPIISLDGSPKIAAAPGFQTVIRPLRSAHTRPSPSDMAIRSKRRSAIRPSRPRKSISSKAVAARYAAIATRQSEVSGTIGSAACTSTAVASIASAAPSSTATRSPTERRRHMAPIRSAMRPIPASVTAIEELRSARPCRIDSAASVCSSTPGMTCPLGNAEMVAELDGGRPDDDFLALELLQDGRIAAQHVHIGDGGHRSRGDAEIDLKGILPVLILAGQERSQRRQELALQHLAEQITAHQAVRLDPDIDDRGPGLLAEFRQRTIYMDRFAVLRIRHHLAKRRQHHRSAGPLQRLGKSLIGGRRRRRAEIDVERDVACAGCFQPVDQLRMQRARPRPHADLIDRAGIDRHQHDVAGGLARKPPEAGIADGILQCLVGAGREHQRQHAQHEKMLSISLHPLTPPAAGLLVPRGERPHQLALPADRHAGVRLRRRREMATASVTIAPTAKLSSRSWAMSTLR